MIISRVPSKALLITIVIIIIITSITASLVLYYYYQQHLWNNTVIEYQQDANVDSGIQLLLEEDLKCSDRFDTGFVYDIYGDETNSVKLSKYRWGAYTLIKVVSQHKNIIKKQAAIVGLGLNDTIMALYMADMGSPLILTDQSEITGDCYLPSHGVKYVYFEGATSKEDALVDCEIKRSGKELPEIDTLKLKNFKNISELKNNPDISIRNYDEVTDTVFQSFFDMPLLITDNKPIRLQNKTIKGQVVITSSKAIYIEEGTTLNDIILIAPKIITGKNVSGNFQAIASDSIIIGKHNTLSYPSALLLITNDSSTINPYLQIDSNSKVLGSVVAYASIPNRFNLKSNIVSTSAITGTFYSNGLLKLQGSVYGEVMCKQFFLSTARGYYLNYLNNGVINRKKLHRAYANHRLMKDHGKVTIVKWLY